MIWPIAFALLFLSAVREEWKKALNGDFAGGLLVSYVFMLLTGVALLGGCGIGLFAGDWLPKRWVQSDSLSLVSMDDKKDGSGPVFLEKSSSDRGSLYIYFRRKIDGGYKLEKVGIAARDIVIVHEEKNTEGSCKIYKEGFAKPYYKLFALQIWPKQRYEFFVPPTSTARGSP